MFSQTDKGLETVWIHFHIRPMINNVLPIPSCHVETVVLLSELSSKQHIEVEPKTHELDLNSTESKAAYDEIKAYVKGHTGLMYS